MCREGRVYVDVVEVVRHWSGPSLTKSDWFGLSQILLLHHHHWLITSSIIAIKAPIKAPSLPSKVILNANLLVPLIYQQPSRLLPSLTAAGQ
jgi:hypothetical protein